MNNTLTPYIIEALSPARVDDWVEGNLVARGDTHVQRLSRFWDEVKTGERAVYVAFSDSDLLGHISLLWRSNYTPYRQKNIPEIVDLWVNPEFRGKKLGQALLHYVEQEAKVKNASAIGLGVGVTHAFGTAHILYHKMNYCPDGTGLWIKGRQVKDDFGSVVIDDTAMLMLVKTL
jgi:GNAT superfamily N-acetyltransferase